MPGSAAICLEGRRRRRIGMGCPGSTLLCQSWRSLSCSRIAGGRSGEIWSICRCLMIVWRMLRACRSELSRCCSSELFASPPGDQPASQLSSSFSRRSNACRSLLGHRATAEWSYRDWDLDWPLSGKCGVPLLFHSWPFRYPFCIPSTRSHWQIERWSYRASPCLPCHCL